MPEIILSLTDIILSDFVVESEPPGVVPRGLFMIYMAPILIAASAGHAIYMAHHKRKYGDERGS